MMNKLSIAPMLKQTDVHFRHLMRMISKNVLLYTEMMSVNYILNGKNINLTIPNNHSPVAAQIAGNNPSEISSSASILESFGYSEVNINIGCPSSKVSSGMIGAVLMKHPEVVADCINNAVNTINIPLTIKTRIGVDDYDSYEYLSNFIKICNSAGCNKFIVHARKAFLQGLNPKQNRTVPPLKYDRVYRLKKDFPGVSFIINGGVQSIKEAYEHLNYVDGVMIGRSAYSNPMMFKDIDYDFYDTSHKRLNLNEICKNYIEYCIKFCEQNTKVHPFSILKHLMNVFYKVENSNYLKKTISDSRSLNDIKNLIKIFTSD